MDVLVPYGYTGSTISTFHAFGDRLVRDYGIELGLTRDLRVCTRAEVLVFLREHVFELGLSRYAPLGDPERFLGDLVTLFDRARDEDVSPARYLEFAAAAGRGGRRRPGAARPRRGRGREGARLRALHRAADAGRARGLQRPAVAGAAAAARASARPARAARPLPLRAGGRVPGHEPRAVRDGQAAGGPAQQSHGGRRRRPEHLPLPRRQAREPDGLPRALPAGARGPAAHELPLAPEPARRGAPAHPQQRPRPPRGPARLRQEPGRRDPGPRRRRAPRVRHRQRRGRLRGAEHRRRGGRRPAPRRLRRPGPRPRPPGPLRAGAQGAGPAVPPEHEPRPVPARRGAALPLHAARGGRPRRQRQRLPPAGLRALRRRSRGPGPAVEPRAPPQPQPARGGRRPRSRRGSASSRRPPRARRPPASPR